MSRRLCSFDVVIRIIAGGDTVLHEAKRGQRQQAGLTWALIYRKWRQLLALLAERISQLLSCCKSENNIITGSISVMLKSA
jgi:hypothetical protein